MTAEPGQALSHYRLLEKIGEGGMGVVWRAEDTILGRTVAIKILPAGASQDEERRRMFLEEARLASSVSAAHIVQVYEFGREGGLDFIVMECIDGRPLHRILHGRPLPPEKVAEIGLQVAQALSQAHRKRLLHRDLKPANILITPDGEVKVVDFGLATLFPASDPDVPTGIPTRTLVGGGRPVSEPVAGTLPYMSPEQIRGEPLDPRTDVFSLGAVLYEMTTGQRPFSAPESSLLAAEIQSAKFRPIPDLVPSVPLDLNRIVQKALAARPADRYQTMEDLAVDLKRLGRDLEAGSSPSFEDLGKPAGRLRKFRRAAVASLVAIAVLAAAGALVARRWWGGTADPATVLILPLKVRGQAEGAEYVGQAFAEALAVHLAPSGGIHVLPVPESFGDGAAGPDSARAARRAGAGRLLAGSLTRLGDRVQANLSLLDTVANRILWGAQKETEEENLTGLAASLARAVARELDADLPRRYDATWNLTGGPEMAADPLTAEALGALRRSEADAAADAARRLVEKYPSEADAHVLRCRALSFRLRQNPVSRTARAELVDCLTALRRVDSSHPFLDVFQAEMQPFGDAIHPLTRALERQDLTPAARVEILQLRSWPKQHAGDVEGATADLEEALLLDPANASILSDLGQVLRLRKTERIDEAVARTRQAVALEPSNWFLYHNLSLALAMARDPAEGIKASRRACDLNPDQHPCTGLAIQFLSAGQKEEAIAAARAAEAMQENHNGTYNLACFWALAGDTERALRFLRRSMDLGSLSAWVAEDPDLESLHGTPEFERILAEMKPRIESGRGADRLDH